MCCSTPTSLPANEMHVKKDDRSCLSHMHPEEELWAAEALESLRNDRNSHGHSGKSPVDASGEAVVTIVGSSYDGPVASTASSESRSYPDNQTEASEIQPKEGCSLWKNMIRTATAMVIPAEETQRRLTYFLKMLRLANEHLHQKVTALQEVIDAENAGIEPKISASAVRQDIVATVRKSMDVITTFASDSLPERARYAVRYCLLSLPQRWASSMDDTTDPAHPGESAALSLATESLAMIQSITGIVDSTLTRADSWCQSLGKRRGPDLDPEEERADELRIRSALNLPPLELSTSTDSEGSLMPISPMIKAEDGM